MAVKKTVTRSREFSDSVIDTIREPLIVLDQDLRVVTASHSFYDFFKVKPEETVGQLIYDLGNKQWDIPKLRELLETILPQKTTFDNYEVEHDFATIGRRVMLLNARQIQRVSGKERIILLAIEDITERKRAESLLRESEERYKALFDHSLDIVFICDFEGRIIDANDAGLNRLGYTREDIHSLNFASFLNEDQLPLAFKILQEIRETGIQKEPAEFRLRHKNGSEVYIETKGSAIISNGTPVAVQQVARDITERKRAEFQNAAALEALQKSEERFKQLAEVFPETIFEANMKGDITYANKNGLIHFGYTEEDVAKGLNIINLISLHDRKIALERVQNSIQGKKGYLEYQALRKDGSTFHAIALSVPIMVDGVPVGIRGFILDITKRKKAEEELLRSEIKFRTLYDSTSDAVMLLDEKGFFDCNKAALAIFGCSTLEEFCTKHPADLSPPQQPCGTDSMALANRMIATAMEKGSHRFEWMHKRNDTGETFPAEVLLNAMELDGKPVLQAVVRDITERKQAEEKIQFLATHDVLTGLPNRSMFSQRLNYAIQAAQRYGRQFAVLFIDLDRFKIINDTLGHEAGDQLLQEIATRLTQLLRAVDVVGRLGGDEFVILIEEVSDSNHVATVAHKILTSIIKPINLMGQESRITASIGICMYPKDAEDEQSLMKNADIAMYLAKEEGKNNYQFFSKDIQSKSLEHLSIETNLRFALERNELSLHYQAKVDFKTNMITGVEALLRWQNPYLGSVTPTQFIPVAEETGLIVPIGKWVLKTACAQNVVWQKQGLPAVCMAVNLSLRQLTDDSLLDYIRTALNDSGMAPNLLELEITESMVMHNPALIISILAKIKSMGVRLAIDDFGTGYSSLAKIQHFPVDTLKIDRSFIRNVPKDAEDKAITEAIIAMGKTLSLTVVAEGVETAEQMNFLKEHSCDEMQGYYFSKPIVPEQFADLLRKHVPYPPK